MLNQVIILINDQNVAKLCDLGLATSPNLEEALLTGEDSDMLPGTYFYMSPELLLNYQAGKANDVWGFACSIVELYAEDLVWELKGYKNAYLCVKDQFENRRIPERLYNAPMFLSSILNRSFDYNPENRPTMKEFINIFK